MSVAHKNRVQVSVAPYRRLNMKTRVFEVKYEWLGRVEVKLVCASSEAEASAKVKNSPSQKILSTKLLGAQG